MQDDNWRQILNLAEKKHRSCQVQSYLYSVISQNVYEMSGNLEDYSKKDMPVAKIYQPLRQRIYGVLFHEKPTVTAVNEWCVESRTVPSQATDVPVVRMRGVGKLIAENTGAVHSSCLFYSEQVVTKLNEYCNEQTVPTDEVSRSVRSIPVTFGRYRVKILTWTLRIITEISHSFYQLL